MLMKDMRMDIPLSDLYQEVILDHNRKPRNYGKPEAYNRYSHGYNPLCGDDYELYLSVDNEGLIQAVGFVGSGCAISKASSSMMTTHIKGKKIDQVEGLKDRFIGMVTEEAVSNSKSDEMKRLRVFEGVRKFPIRVKCATLIWHALEDAIKQGSVSRDE